MTLARVPARRLQDRCGALRPAARPVRYSVGRWQPNNEIAELDAAAEQLRADLRAYNPPQAGQACAGASDASDRGPLWRACVEAATQEASNWAALTHKANGWILQWGQFKTALAHDNWWGDDDEVRLAGLKTEYNTIRQEVIDFTKIEPKAPGIDPSPPGLDPPPPTSSAEKTLYAILVVSIVGGGLYAAFKIIPLFVPVLSTAVGAAAAASTRR